MGILEDEYGALRMGCIIPAAIVALGIAIGIGGCITNKWKSSEGDRVGMVNKVSKKGAIWGTYEGQMALEGITSDGKTSGANVWDFSIDNYLPQDKQQELQKKLEEVMNSGQKVKIHYTEMVCTWPWRSGSSVLIQSIEPVNVKGIEGKIQNAPQQNVSQTENTIKANGDGYFQVTVDGRDYMLKHDTSGKLKIMELKEVK